MRDIILIKYLSKFLLICLLIFSTISAFAQSKREMKKMEEEMERRAKFGFKKSEASVNDCDLLKKELAIAVIPFQILGSESKVQTNDYDPTEIVREYAESYLGKIEGWSAIDKARTDIYSDKLQSLVKENVLEESDVRDLKQAIGADIVIGGTITGFIQGEYGSAGSAVNIQLKGVILETSQNVVFSGTIEGMSGSYEFDKSVIVMLNEYMGDFAEDLKSKLDECP